MMNKYSFDHLVDGDQDFRWCHKYCHDVLSGNIVAGKWIKAAAERHFRMMEDDRFYFDEEKAKSIVLWFKFIPITDGNKVGKATTLLPWQIWLVCSLIAWKWRATGLRVFKYAYVQVGRKNGKALALDTPIMTPSGWKTMGDIKIGDTVFGADGKPTKVVNESEIFKDHDCYEIEFSNGEKITADADHLWKTTARVNRVGSGTNKGYKLKDGESSLERVRTTEELFKTQTFGSRGDRNHSINVCSAIEHEERNFPVDPYILGMWLGDGNSQSPRVTCAKSDLEFILGQIKSRGYVPGEPRSTNSAFNVNVYDPDTDFTPDKIGRYKNKLNKKLRDIGVLNNKHIPPEYLTGSIEQRLLLLQGLMDTDGTICKRGRMSFTQKNKTLSYQVMELISSLGIKVSIKKKRVKCNGVDAGFAYKLFFSCNKSEMPVFAMPRKLERMVDGNESGINQRCKTVQIVSVKKVDTVKTKCIQVDNDDKLFVCGKTNIVTHNSTLAGGLTLYLMYASGYFRPRAYSVATKKDQAKELWSAAKTMIKLSPRLSQVFKAMTHDILMPSKEGSFVPLASDSNSLDGLNPLVANLDECHAIKDRNLYGVMVSAFGAQPEGLMLTITTAGTVLDGICTDLNKNGKRVLSGETNQDSYFYALYEIDDAKKWDDESEWIKANPGLGHQPRLDYMHERCIESSMSSEEKANFLTKHCNVFVSGSDKWLDMDELRACRALGMNLGDYHGKKVYIGIDKSRTADLTSFCLLFPTDDGGADCFYQNWLPKQTAVGVTDHLQQIYRKASDRNELTLLDSATVRDDPLIEWLHWANKTFNVEMICYDPYHMSEIAEDLDELGYPMVSVSQGAGNMSEPAKKLEGLIKERLFRYNNSLLEFAASNAIMKMTDNNNVKITRENSKTDKIDPIISTIIALSGATLKKVEQNIYEERGFFSL